MNAKICQDILAIILDHEVDTGESLKTIDIGYLGKLRIKPVGLYTTLSDNLHRIKEEMSDFLTVKNG